MYELNWNQQLESSTVLNFLANFMGTHLFPAFLIKNKNALLEKSKLKNSSN